MDIKTLLNNLHEEVSCSVCMDTFTDPKQLPCLHSFCLHCLNGILRTSGRHDIITCPECRKESNIPGSGNLKDLPTNFRLNSLLDVLAIKECDTMGVKCGNCDKRSAQSFYCFQCCAFWCEECITAHNIIRANKEHRVLALKDFQDQDIENVLKRPVFCAQKHHEREELKFFCNKCKVAICNACAVTDHEGHVKILLEKASNERKLKIQSFILSNKQKALEMRDRTKNLDEYCTEIQTQASNMKRSVEQFVENIIATINAKKLKVFHEVDRQAEESVQRLVLQKNEIENQVKMIEAFVEDTETLLKRATNADIVQVPLDAFCQVKGENGDKQVDCADLRGICKFIFEENKTLIDKANNEGIGSVKTFFSKTKARQSSADGKGISEAIVGLESNFVLKTGNVDREQCYEWRDCVTVEIQNHQDHDCATGVRVQDNKDGSYKISYFAKETGKCEASVKVNGEHIRGSPFPIEVKPKQFRPVLLFGQQGSSVGMLCFPWGVAVDERNEIAVTDHGNHRVQVFSSDGTYLRSFGRKGHKHGEFHSPTGIAFDSNGNIIVVDSANHRVQGFSGQGEYLTQFGGKESLHHQLNFPGGLSVDNDGNFIVAERGSQLITIHSPSGRAMRKIGGQSLFSFPIHCVQHDQYLIVSDSGENCIKVFQREGNFLYKFGNQGEGRGELNIPRCLSVDKAHRLMVCDTKNHRIQVFELNGNFVGSFGKKGSEVGEFLGPVSTAVLSDGRIVVSDFYNHRIQIFE